VRPLVPLLILGAALVVLVTAGTPDARELGQRLSSDSAAERDAAARELKDMGEGARDTLEVLARDGAPEARRRSRALLGLLDSEDRLTARARGLEARALLRSALRQRGRLAAGSAHDERIAELADDGARAVAAHAAREVARASFREQDALAVARHPSTLGVAALTAALRRDGVAGSAIVRAARALVNAPAEMLGDEARRSLQTVLAQRGDPRRRAAAALLLAFEPDHAGQLALDGDPRVRIEAALALGRRGGCGASALERLAADVDTDVRAAALEALRHVPGAPRPGPAHENAEHADPRLRAAAARLLARDAVPESLPVLARLATDDSARVRAAAERSLAALGDR
jgi:hypothetical protein